MIYLVRHGQTEFNREGRFQGVLDSPLDEVRQPHQPQDRIFKLAGGRLDMV